MVEGRQLLPAASAPAFAVGVAAWVALCAPVGWAAPAGAAALFIVVVVAWRQAQRAPQSADLQVERRLPRRLSVGKPATIVLALHNRSEEAVVVRLAPGCPPVLGLTSSPRDLELGSGQRQEVELSVVPQRRGRVTLLALQLRARRPHALIERQWESGGEVTVKVFPSLLGLGKPGPSGPRRLLQAGGGRSTRVPGADGEFERLRPWVSGDDLRHVDWKATARARHPVTRVYQEEQSQTLLVLVDGTRLMAAQTGSGSKMDHAVGAALALCYAGLSRGDRVGVAVFDQGVRCWLAPRAGVGQLGRAMELLFDAYPTQGFPQYGEASRVVLARLRRRALVVWLTELLDSAQGEALEGGLRALRRRHLSLVVSLDDPELHEAASRAPVARRYLFARAAAQELLDERQALARRLSAQGAQVLTASPDALRAGLVERYFALKARGAI